MKNRLSLALTLTLALLCVSATVEPQYSVEEIRICAVSETEKVCPTDNPVFSKEAGQVLINFNSNRLKRGDEIRFSWYRLDDSELFSTYLGNEYVMVNEVKSAEGITTVTTCFPKSIELSPGVYEVIIHPPGDARPIIKNFKVLD